MYMNHNDSQNSNVYESHRKVLNSPMISSSMDNFDYLREVETMSGVVGIEYFPTWYCEMNFRLIWNFLQK